MNVDWFCSLTFFSRFVLTIVLVHTAAMSAPLPDCDSSSGDHLSDIMQGVAVYFNGMSEEEVKQAKRYIIAYPLYRWL